MPDGLSVFIQPDEEDIKKYSIPSEDDLEKYPIPSHLEKERAIELRHYSRCPHCGVPISLTDAISMVQGNGCPSRAPIARPASYLT